MSAASTAQPTIWVDVIGWYPTGTQDAGSGRAFPCCDVRGSGERCWCCGRHWTQASSAN